jgi:hypothetical protein
MAESRFRIDKGDVKMMTVAELIAKLRELPSDAVVALEMHDRGIWPARHVDVKTYERSHAYAGHQLRLAAGGDLKAVVISGVEFPVIGMSGLGAGACE